MSDQEQAYHLKQLKDHPSFSLLKAYMLEISEPNLEGKTGMDAAVEAMRYAYYLEGIKAVFNLVDAVVTEADAMESFKD